MATQGCAAATARARSRCTSRRAAPRGSAGARHVGHVGLFANHSTAHWRHSEWPQPNPIGSSNQSPQTLQLRASLSFRDASRMRSLSSSLSFAGVHGGSLALRDRRVVVAMVVVLRDRCAHFDAQTAPLAVQWLCR